MQNFKRNALTIALLSSGLMSLNFSANAAETPQAEEDIEIIEVTGIRRSLADSQAVKMTKSSIVEAVSAEDIGKLPDVSIAESIARLPGVTAQRLNGRANVISIRGLAPDFTTATLNGREQVTIGDNRGVEFDQYPSELLSGVVVYKTPDAKLINQAIGGTIDMQTIRPLSHGKQTFSVGARYEKNDLGALNAGSEDTGHRTNFSYIDQFADDTIGIAFGVADMSSPNQEERWAAWGFPNDKVDDQGTLLLGGAKPYVRSSELERTGYMGVFEYQPNDKFHTVIDAYYSDYREEQLLRGIELPLGWGGEVSLDPNYVVEDGLVTEGTFNNVHGLIRNDVNIRDAEVVSLGWNTTYQLTDNWSIEADVSYSKADRTDFGLESYAGAGRPVQDTDGNWVHDPRGTDNLGFKMEGAGGITFNPTLDYADTSRFMLGGPQAWGNSTVNGNGQDGFINNQEIEDKLKAIRFTAERTFDDGFISSVEFGFNYSEREKSKEDVGTYLRLKNYDENSHDGMAVPEEYLLNPTSLNFIGMGDMLSYDSLALYKSGDYYNEYDQNEDWRKRGTYSISEDVLISYVQLNIDTEVLGFPVSGNTGLQAVYTDQSSTGTATTFVDGELVAGPAKGGSDYTELLPSLSLNVEVAENQMVRLGASRTLARARMDQMNASVGYDYNNANEDATEIEDSPWSGSGGNPELEPTIANQYDLSYEMYFDDLGYWSVAGFYKGLQSYVFNESVEFDFSDVTPPPGQDPTQTTGLVSAPANGEGGHISGIEGTLSLSASMIHPALSGFGVIVSGSITESEVQETSDSDPIALPGLSKKVLNATAYYEDHGFQARISSRYRSDFLGEVSGLSMARDKRYVSAELVVDAQIGYDFTESGFAELEGLSVMLQVSNLTDEPFSTYENGDTRQVKDYQVYGRNFMLGMNYTF